MLSKLNELRKGREEGFTLIELLVVIGIIGVLAAVALPIFLNQQQAAAKSSVQSDVRNSVTNISTLLISTPAAATAALQAQAVVSGTNVITVTGSGGSYKIKGTTPAVTAWSYNFDAATGKYSEGV